MKHGNSKKGGTAIEYLGNHREMIPLVASWIYREWSFLYPDWSAGHVEKILRERVHKRRLPITFVAFLDGKPAGTVSLKEFEIDERPDLTPWVTSLYVVPEARHRGVGKELMRACEDHARRMGTKELFLFTADPGLASGLYGGLGWKIRERITYLSYPVIVMTKKLMGKVAAA